MELYFAYASNLSLAQITERCPTAEPECRAVLEGFRLEFPRRSRRWGGGAAGIIRAAGEVVEGAVYRLSEQDLRAMDGFEGVAQGCYARGLVRVRCPESKELEVWTYFPRAESGGPFAPSRTYLDTILTGAREHGLSADYIRTLEGIRTHT